MTRCSWAKPDNKLYCNYHDNEWGAPTHDDQQLFEMLLLEGAQAGLSWETVLNKRKNYRTAFDGLDPYLVARYDDAKVAELLQNAGIIRNKLKINSAIRNAKVFIGIQKEYGSFDEYLWGFVDNKPVINKFKLLSDMPALTALSLRISKDLKSKGMNFVGPTIIYAFMQSTGMVNDHVVSCFKYNQVT